jgi:type III secretory pathway lipoprotein EscJ
MKNIVKLSFVLAAAALLTGCNCFKQMAKQQEAVKITATPEVLVLNNGVIEADIHVSFPAEYFNAKAVADKGGAILIEEKDIDETSFKETVRELRADPERLARMGRMAHEIAARSASDIIYEEIVKDLWKKANA